MKTKEEALCTMKGIEALLIALSQYTEKMEQGVQSDLFLGHTGAGVHRDDLLLWIDGKPAKEFGSQGQKKSLAAARSSGCASPGPC